MRQCVELIDDNEKSRDCPKTTHALKFHLSGGSMKLLMFFLVMAMGVPAFAGIVGSVVIVGAAEINKGEFVKTAETNAKEQCETIAKMISDTVLNLGVDLLQRQETNAAQVALDVNKKITYRLNVFTSGDIAKADFINAQCEIWK